MKQEMTPGQFAQVFRQPGQPVHCNFVPTNDEGEPNGALVYAELVDASAVDAFVTERGGKGKVLFLPNVPKAGLKQAPKNEEIEYVTGLAVDIDPVKGADLLEERQRVEALFENLPAGVPAPSIRWRSGRLEQAFWKFQTPIPLDPEGTTAEMLNERTRWLETQLGADPRPFVAIQLRLAGAPNIKAFGTFETYVIEYKPERLYSPENFGQVASPDKVTEVALDEIGPGDVKPINSVEELAPYGLSKRTLELLCNGRVVGVPHRRGSDDVYDAVCQLLEAGMTPAEAAGVISSVRVLNIGRRVSAKNGNQFFKVLNRILRDANSKIKADDISQMNERFKPYNVERNEPGVVCREVDSDNGCFVWRNMSQTAFLNRPDMKTLVSYGQDPKGKDLYMTKGKYWLNHAKCIKYDGLVYRLDREAYCDVVGEYRGQTYRKFNMAPGFCIEADYLSDDKPWGAHYNTLKPLWIFLRDIICGCRDDTGKWLKNYPKGTPERREYEENYKHFKWLMRHLAYWHQNPGKPGLSSVALVGEQGIGKSKFAEIISAVWGESAQTIDNEKEIVGDFNSVIRGTTVLTCEEALYSGSAKQANRMKNLHTKAKLRVQLKGIDTFEIINCLKIILLSNNEHFLYLEPGDRRHFVKRVREFMRNNKAYFKALTDSLWGVADDEGRYPMEGFEKWLGLLLCIDVSAHDTTPPMTREKQLQKQLTCPVQNFLRERLENGYMFAGEESYTWPSHYGVVQLYEEFKYTGLARPTEVSQITFAQKLVKLMPPYYQKLAGEVRTVTHPIKLPNGNTTAHKARTTVREIPPLAIWREHLATAEQWVFASYLPEESN